MLLELLQFIALLCGLLITFFPHQLNEALDARDGVGASATNLHRWPTDATADIAPVPCHSHNDYWRREPLFSAVKAGCIGVEADVWLLNDDLNVGHSTASLTPNRTLRSLYVNPLLQMLDKQNPVTSFHLFLDIPRNGIFDTNPSQSLVLLIDFKTDGHELWDYVHTQLEPLRQKQYLSHFNGSAIITAPITVVVTGNAPFNRVVADYAYRDMFFDAPLDVMASLDIARATEHDSLDEFGTTSGLPFSSAKDPNQGQGHSGSAPLNPYKYSPANSYYASASFKQSIGFPWRSHLSSSQISLIRKQIGGAHARGLKVRYWDVPAWPKGLRNYLWRVLVEEGVDILNVDDLSAAAEGSWRRRPEKGWWSRWSTWS